MRGELDLVRVRAGCARWYAGGEVKGRAMDESERLVQSLIIRYLLGHTQCSGCGRRYNAGDVRIHDHRGDVWLALVTCSHCGLQGLIMAAVRTRDSQEMEPALELDAEECSAFQQMESITSDEVLDFHRFLEEFRGDVHQLFAGPNQPL